MRRWVGKKRGTGAVPSWRTRGERRGRWSSRLGAPASANTIFERVDLPSASARARYASCASGGAGDVGALSRDDVSSETGKHDGTSRRHARARSRGVRARRRTLSGSRTACMLVMLVRTLSGSAIASAVGASASRVPRDVLMDNPSRAVASHFASSANKITRKHRWHRFALKITDGDHPPPVTRTRAIGECDQASIKTKSIGSCDSRRDRGITTSRQRARVLAAVPTEFARAFSARRGSARVLA